MAYIRKRETGKLDKFGNCTTSYQVVWREPVRDEFGAPTGKFKQTSETFPTERKAKTHLRKVENQLDAVHGVNPSDAKLKANTPLATYARQYLDSLVGLIDPNTIEGYEKIYRTHLAPRSDSDPLQPSPPQMWQLSARSYCSRMYAVTAEPNRPPPPAPA